MTREEKRRSTPVVPILFERFWKAYPRKVAKQDALKAWNKANPDEALTETILAAVERARGTDTWRKQNGEFIPYPATYINGKRWEDALPTEQPGEKRVAL